MRFNVRRTALAAALLAAVGSTLAYANGLWPTLPQVGQPSFCGAILGTTPGTGGTTGNQPTSTICAQTIPAGPLGFTGNELVPMDTNLPGGQAPQTVTAPVGLLAPGAVYQGSYASPKNLLRNGDISVNPFQRGTSQAADISNTLTYGPDGFAYLGGASSAINWSSQTAAADIVANQFTKSVRFQRKSANADLAQICQVNVLTSQDSVALQGQKFVYSFWALPGANFSPSQGNLVVKVASGTGANQSAATFVAGTWTAQANAIVAAGSNSTTFTGTVATSVATFQTLPTASTAAWTQYWVSGTIPATATQVGTEICFTGVGTAGANDWIETSNHQLEIVAGGAVTPTAFEHHLAQVDLAIAQRFFYRLTETAAVTPVASCSAVDTTHTNCLIQFPVSMRAIPTMTYANGFASPTSTTQATLGACTTLAAAATVASTAANVLNALANCTATTIPAAGIASFLYSNGGTGLISASAEL